MSHPDPQHDPDNVHQDDKPTKEQWQKWYNHKSNKEIWIEEQERKQEEED